MKPADADGRFESPDVRAWQRAAFLIGIECAIRNIDSETGGDVPITADGPRQVYRQKNCLEEAAGAVLWFAQISLGDMIEWLNNTEGILCAEDLYIRNK
jgi:hypothetical protein